MDVVVVGALVGLSRDCYPAIDENAPASVVLGVVVSPRCRSRGGKIALQLEDRAILSLIKSAFRRSPLGRLGRFNRLDDAAYLKAYARDTDRRVERDPHTAIGGLWEEMGELQFSYLEASGLQPQHTLLDIGCGTLRGGRRFIPYLVAGNYTGVDISQAALTAAAELCREEGLDAQRPRLELVTDTRLDYSFLGQRYDYLLAQSVFSHLREAQIIELLSKIPKVMRPGGQFHFTYFPHEEKKVRAYKDFAYPFSFIREAAERAGLTAVERPEYRHPHGQAMVEARLKAEAAAA